MKKLKLWFKEHKSFLTRAFILAFLLVALPLTVYINSQNQDTRQRAAETANPLFCSWETWQPVPDFLKGNNGLGTEQKAYPPDYSDEEKRETIKPGPVIQKGDPIVTSRYKHDGSLDWNVVHGGKLPVKYEPGNDITRYEFSGRKFAESNWSRFVRRMDDSYYTIYSSEMSSNKIALGVLIKYELMRISLDGIGTLLDTDDDVTQRIKDYHAGKLTVESNIGAHGRALRGETITPQLLSEVIGFDVTGPEFSNLEQWVAASDRVRGDHMIAETTTSCGSARPTPKPTSTTPVSCDEHLLVPPADFAVEIPPFSPNICSEATEYNAETGHAYAQELIDCGDYWVTNWCNASTDAQKSNVTYACRGWSQIGEGKPGDDPDSFYRFYPKRLFTITTSNGTNPGGALLSNINKYGDVRGRRITWNQFMNELKTEMIAFPYGYKDVAGALQAAAAAIFDKPFGAIVEQERLNNCSTTWDGSPPPPPLSEAPISQPVTPPVTPIITPPVSPTDGTTLKLTFLLDGIGAAGDYTNSKANSLSTKNPQTTSRDFALDFYNGTEKISTKLGTMTYTNAQTGTFTSTLTITDEDLDAGEYTAKVKVNGYLIKGIGEVTIGATGSSKTVTVTPTTLITGDINSDNALNLLDYNILADCYSDINQAKSCSAPNKVLTDLNDDGNVNQFDFNLFVRELPKQKGD